MGSSQSPAASGCFGAAFVRMVREQCSRFQCLPTQHDVVTLLKGHDFDPTLGMGCILIDEHDITALLVTSIFTLMIYWSPALTMTRLVQLCIGYLTVQSEWG
jgi:hypothetical protein